MEAQAGAGLRDTGQRNGDSGKKGKKERDSAAPPSAPPVGEAPPPVAFGSHGQGGTVLNSAVMKRQSGFTIIELLIVVAIAAVLAALGGPAMGTFIKNNRLQSKTHAVMADILFARAEAVNRKIRVVMCRSADAMAATPSCGGNAQDWGTGGYIVFVDNNGNATYENGTDELLRRGAPGTNNVTLRTNGTSNNNLEFNVDGTTRENGGTARFAVCDERGVNFGRQLDVPPHGRPKITTGSQGDPISSCTNPA